MITKSRLNALLAVGFALAMPAVALAESFTVKTGAWEMTTTQQMTGMLVPSEELAKMPPAQRAAIEKSMQAHAGGPKTHVAKSCLTQEDLDQNRILESDDDEGCTQKVVAQSATKLVVDKTCPAPDTSTTHMSMEAKTTESIVATFDMARGDSDGKVHVSITGRWLGASCAGIGDDE